MREHPDIARVLRSGYLDEDRPIVCPVCGEEFDVLYTSMSNEPFGCDCCVKRWEAWEARENEIV